MLAIAFIISPLFLVIAAAIYLSGIERSVDGTSSWVEGMFMGLAMIMFVPLYLELAGKLGQNMPLLAIICTIGVVGFGFGVIPASHRITQAALTEAGFQDSVWTLASHTGSVPSIIWMGLGFLSSILLGVGFLRTGGISRSSATLLIITPIIFVIGQGGDETIAWWQVSIVYPVATVLWLIAFAPIGWHYLRGREVVGAP